MEQPIRNFVFRYNGSKWSVAIDFKKNKVGNAFICGVACILTYM